MEKYKTDKLNYNYIVEISISIALVLIILTVQFFPRLTIFNGESDEYFEGTVRLDDIPVTIQKSARSTAKKVKVIPPAAIFVPVDYEVILEEPEFDEDLVIDEITENGNDINTDGVGDNPLIFSFLPYLVFFFIALLSGSIPSRLPSV